jgi:amidase
VFRVVQYDDIWQAHGEWITRVQPTFGPQMQLRFAAVAANDVVQVAPMQQARADIRARLDALLSNNAVLLLPTISDVAPKLLATPQETVTFRERALGLLCIAGLGGLPQLSLPFATLNGLPVGLSMIAARGNDEMLLDIASELETRA